MTEERTSARRAHHNHHHNHHHHQHQQQQQQQHLYQQLRLNGAVGNESDHDQADEDGVGMQEGLGQLVEAKFKRLRQRLDHLGYRQPLGLESLPLVEKLFSDLVHTTGSLKTAKETLARRSSHVAASNDDVIEPYKEDNAKLVKEVNELQTEIMRRKDVADAQLKKLKLHLRQVTHENSDLRFLNSQYAHQVQSLQRENDLRQERIDRLLSQNLQAVITTDTGRQATIPTRRQRMELSSSATDALSDEERQHAKEARGHRAKPVPQKVIDIVKASNAQVASYKEKIKEMETARAKTETVVQTLQAQVGRRDKEIERLGRLLEGGRSIESIQADHKHESTTRHINKLETHVECLQQTNKALQAELLALKQESSSSVDQIATLQAQNDQLSYELTKLERLAEEMEKERASAELSSAKELQRERTQIEHDQKIVREKLREVTSLQLSFKQLQEQNHQLSAALKEASQQVKRMHLQVEKLTQDNLFLESRLKGKQPALQQRPTSHNGESSLPAADRHHRSSSRGSTITPPRSSRHSPTNNNNMSNDVPPSLSSSRTFAVTLSHQDDEPTSHNTSGVSATSKESTANTSATTASSIAMDVRLVQLERLVSSLETANEDRLIQLDGVLQQRDELKAQYDAILGQVSKMQAASRSNADLLSKAKQENVLLVAEKKKLEETVSSLHRDLESLQRSIDDEKSVNAQQVQIDHHEHERFQHKIDELTQELQRKNMAAERQAKIITDLSEQASVQDAQIKLLVAERDSLQRRQGIDNSMSSTSAFTIGETNYGTNVNDVRAQKADVEMRYHKLEKDFRNVKASMGASMKRNREMIAEIETLLQSKRADEAKIDEMTHALAAAEEELEELNNKLHELTRPKTPTHGMEAQAQRIGDLKSQLVMKEDECKSAIHDLNLMTSECVRMQRKNEELSERLEHFEKEVKETKSLLKEATDARNSLVNQLISLNASSPSLSNASAAETPQTTTDDPTLLINSHDSAKRKDGRSRATAREKQGSNEAQGQLSVTMTGPSSISSENASTSHGTMSQRSEATTASTISLEQHDESGSDFQNGAQVQLPANRHPTQFATAENNMQPATAMRRTSTSTSASAPTPYEWQQQHAVLRSHKSAEENADPGFPDNHREKLESELLQTEQQIDVLKKSLRAHLKHTSHTHSTHNTH